MTAYLNAPSGMLTHWDLMLVIQGASITGMVHLFFMKTGRKASFSCQLAEGLT
jgi:hypothetical protein